LKVLSYLPILINYPYLFRGSKLMEVVDCLQGFEVNLGYQPNLRMKLRIHGTAVVIG
jgi:hypothetical protein